MSDLAARADDYEQRLANAPSTEAIVGSLVKSAHRNERSLRLLAISLIVDIVLSVAMAALALIAWDNAEGIEANTTELTRVVHQQCLADVTAAKSIVTVLDTLIDATTANTLLTPAAKAQRVANYEAAKPHVRSCTDTEGK